MPTSTTRREKIALVLQGGGALGAYQAGAYEALHAANLQPDWVAGISIGAINAAIIAGNLPQNRAARLHDFWNTVSSHLLAKPALSNDAIREAFNDASAALVATFGTPGFFSPRPVSPLFNLAKSPETLSFYDTAPLQKTLETLIDFDLLNKGKVRLSIGAVNVRTGNLEYFDNHQQEIGPQHIMASGALPPGFPAIEINGEFYWDGGLVSNTPLQYVIDQPCYTDMPDLLIFQIDLFSAMGPLPRTLSEIGEREKDIRFSSRTRLNTDVIRKSQAIGRAAQRLAKKLPAKFARDPDLQALLSENAEGALTIVHLIHRSKHFETQSKDYEFSRHTVEEHWKSGTKDVRHSLRHPLWLKRPAKPQGILVLDLAQKPIN